MLDKYIINEYIDKGHFGEIIKGTHKTTGKLVAIKIERKEHSNSLKNEAKIYQYLDGIDGIPKLKWYETNEKMNILVIDLLGNSIEKIVSSKPLPLDYTCKIGVQMIEIIYRLHNMSLIHRDIKPSNFLFGIENPEKIHLIDFGLCKRYIYNDQHIPIKKISSIIGSYNFVSLNVLNGIEPSRRDDIESCIYVMIYMLLGNLNWINLKTHLLEETNIMVPIKIKKLLSYVRQLSFDDEPGYKYIVSILRENN